jgi:hypothetical protein
MSPRFLAPAFLSILLACGQGRQWSDRDAEITLRTRLQTYDSAWVAKDSTTIEKILAPQYAYFTSTGDLSSRIQTFTFLADTSYQLTRSHRTELAVTVAGPVARISSRWEGSGRYQGEPVEDDQTCGQTWVFMSGDWKLFTEHCANRPPSESAM